MPITKGTGSETCACRFRAEKKSSERRIISTARPTCRPSARNRSASSATADSSATLSPRNVWHNRQASRRAVAGCSSSRSATLSPSKRSVFPRMVLGVSSCQSGRNGVSALDDRPAGQRPRDLLDVALGELADAEGEELHQLAGEVLVRLALPVRRGVEPVEKGGIAEHRPQQVAERPAAMAAKRLVLPAHGLDVLDLELAGREVVVPDQSEALGQGIGREEHPVEPPGLEPADVAAAGGCVAQQIGGRGEFREHALNAAGAVQDPVHRRIGAALQIAL